MKVLFVGGTGLISSAVTMSIKDKVELTLLNRGTKLIKGTNQITCDINDIRTVKHALEDNYFDVVVNWIAFTREDVERDYELFYGHTKQYIFISSASAYEKPVQDYPITEETILRNPYWEYSRNKILCEDFLNSAHSDMFNVTIVRPSHTYDDQKLMLTVKEWGSEYTVLKRIIDGKKYIIPDAGTSLWTITHNSDFAKGFIPLLGNKQTYGEDYHITSDFHYTWEQLYNITCKSLGVKPNPIHIPTSFVLKYLPHKEGEFYGDKHWSVIFDNKKIKSVAKGFECSTRYEDVVDKAINHYQNTPELQKVDKNFDEIYQKIIKDYESLVAK